MSFFRPSIRARNNVALWAQVMQAVAIIGGGAWAAWTYHHQVQDEKDQAKGHTQAVERELERPYYEKQLNLYLEASKIVADLATLPDGEERKQAEQRFWELHWGELAFVESPTVEALMKGFCVRLYDTPLSNPPKCTHREDTPIGDALNFSHTARDEIKTHWHAPQS